MTPTRPHEGATIRFQPRIRKGAFFDAAWRYGCRSFSVYNRTYISSTFSNPVDEYWQVVNRAALWPVMGERQVEVTGPDAAAFVQLLTTRDMSRCAVGQCKYALITDQAGGILCDPIILRPDAGRYWLSTSDCDLELWAKGVAVNSGLEVAIRDAGVSVLQVQGPKSPAVMAGLFGAAVLELKYYRLTVVPFEGSDLVVSRTGFSGEFGYEIYLRDASKGDALFDALMTAGEPVGLVPGCVSQARRIEAGILSWGVDMTEAETPYEVGLGRLVELDGTPDFIGRDALARLARETPRRRLAGLVIDGAPLAPNEDVWPLRAGGRVVGRLTSLAHSPGLEKNLALAILEAAHAAPGSVVSVETWDGPRRATVSPLPFVTKRQAGPPGTA